MPVPVYVAPREEAKIYRIGRVGFDSGNRDPGGAYTAVLRTEKHSPAGEHGLVHFRRIGVRVLHNAAFKLKVRVYVDEKRTKVYDASGQLVDQEIVFDVGNPGGLPVETLLEGSISARGTFIEVELEILSSDVSGILLPEAIEIHMRPIRSVRQRGAESS